MSCGRSTGSHLARYLTYYEEGNEKAGKLPYYLASNDGKASANLFSEEEIKDTRIKWLQGTAELAKYVLSNEENQSTTTLPSLWGHFKALVQNCHSDAFFTEVTGTNTKIKSSCHEDVTGRNSHQHSIQHPTGDPSCCIETWQLFLDSIFDGRN